MTNRRELYETCSDLIESMQAELRYLRYFYQAADFGPAHCDVVAIINEDYDGEFPEGYGPDPDEEEK